MSQNQAQRWPSTSLLLPFAATLVIAALGLKWHKSSQVEDAIFKSGTRSPNDWPDMRIDINRAIAAELALLPGVGERLAQRIVTDRESNGDYASLNDLRRVSGIGAITIERLRPYAFVNAPAKQPPEMD